MKIKSYTLVAVLVTISASISATTTWGVTPQGGGRSALTQADSMSPEQLARLAADLARTAAKLAEVKHNEPAVHNLQSVYDTEAARQFRPQQSRPEANSSVRWVGTQVENAMVYEPAQKRTGKVPPPTVVHVTSESPVEEPEFSFASDQEDDTVTVAQTNRLRSRVIRTQASEVPSYTARAYANEDSASPGNAELQDFAADYNGTENPAAWNNPVLEGDICTDTCCDISCDPGCCCGQCCPPRRRIVIAGTEAVFLSPDINGGRVSFIFNEYEPTTSTSHYGPAQDHADINDFYIAPRLWVGIQGECWGVVGRYFHLRAGEHDHDPSIPANRGSQTPIYDQGFDGNSLLEAYYADLELTRNFCLHGCKNQFSFGVRYADLEHHESIVGMVETEDGLINGGARANRRAYGTGLTFGLNGRKPLFCNSCAHWFYNVRSSVLWGCTRNEAETWAEAIVLDNSVTALAGSKDGAISANNDDLFIGEVQLGLEWNFAMRCLPAKSFFRLAAEYQYWDSSIGHAGSGSFSGFENTNTSTARVIGNTLADAPGLLVNMYGFHVGTGFTW